MIELRGLRLHLIERQRRILEDRTLTRDDALSAIVELDSLEDTRPLLVEEHAARKKLQDGVAEVDLKIEMVVTAIQEIVAGGRGCQYPVHPPSGKRQEKANPIHSIRVGDRTYSGHSPVETAIVNHFRTFYRKGPRNMWKCTGEGAVSLCDGQQEQITRPFIEEEVRAAMQGLNREGAPGPDGILVFFYQKCWNLVGLEMMATIEDFRIGVCNMDHMNKTFVALNRWEIFGLSPYLTPFTSSFPRLW